MSLLNQSESSFYVHNILNSPSYFASRSLNPRFEKILESKIQQHKEVKFFDVTQSFSLYSYPKLYNVCTLNRVWKGGSAYERIGNRITLKSISMDVNVTLPSNIDADSNNEPFAIAPFFFKAGLFYLKSKKLYDVPDPLLSPYDGFDYYFSNIDSTGHLIDSSILFPNSDKAATNCFSFPSEGSSFQGFNAAFICLKEFSFYFPSAPGTYANGLYNPDPTIETVNNDSRFTRNQLTHYKFKLNLMDPDFIVLNNEGRFLVTSFKENAPNQDSDQMFEEGMLVFVFGTSYDTLMQKVPNMYVRSRIEFFDAR